MIYYNSFASVLVNVVLLSQHSLQKALLNCFVCVERVQVYYSIVTFF